MTRRYVITDDAVQVYGGRLHRPDCPRIPGGEQTLIRSGSSVEITAPPEVEGTDRHEHEELSACKLCVPAYEEVFPSSPAPRTAGEIRAYAQGYAAAINDTADHGIEAARMRLRSHSEAMKLMDDVVESHGTT